MEVAPHGTAYLRLWFNAKTSESATEVYLFLNDDSGQNEEVFAFRVL
jgi:hypothetical protein